MTFADVVATSDPLRSGPVGCGLGGPRVWPASGDATVRALVAAWATKPWIDGIRMALADRLEEVGAPRAAGIVRSFSDPTNRLTWDALPRRDRQRTLRQWRWLLRDAFGDFDQKTLPCEVPADTPQTEPPF